MLSELYATLEVCRKYHTGELSEEERNEIDKRLEVAQFRMLEYDKEIEARIKAKEVTNELLNKSCNL